jgi:hypothetical protein
MDTETGLEVLSRTFQESTAIGKALDSGSHGIRGLKAFRWTSTGALKQAGRGCYGFGGRRSMSIFFSWSSSVASRLILSSFSLESARSLSVSCMSPTTNFASAA